MTEECRKLDKKYKRFLQIGIDVEKKTDVIKTYEKLSEYSNFAKEQIERVKSEIKDLECEKERLLIDIMNDFQLVDNIKWYQILKAFYIDGSAWNVIAEDIGFDERYTVKLRDKALVEIAGKK